jgi:ribosomal protein S13
MGQVPEVVRLEAMEEYQLDRAMGEYQLDRAMGEYQLDRAMGVGRSEATEIQEELVMDQAEAMEEVPSDQVQVTVVLAAEAVTDHRVVAVMELAAVPVWAEAIHLTEEEEEDMERQLHPIQLIDLCL